MNRIGKFVGAAALGFTLLGWGCATEHPAQIPEAASMRVEGNRHLEFTAPTDGVAYIYDTNTDKVIWSGGLLQGQTLTLDTSRNQVMAAGRLVSQVPLSSGDDYRIYFNNTPVVTP
jgi:hypothetical protein